MKVLKNDFRTNVASLFFQKAIDAEKGVVVGVGFFNRWGDSWKRIFNNLEEFETWWSGDDKLGKNEDLSINLWPADDTDIRKAFEVKGFLKAGQVPADRFTAKLLYSKMNYKPDEIIGLVRETKGSRLTDDELVEVILGTMDGGAYLYQSLHVRMRVIEKVIERLPNLTLKVESGKMGRLRYWVRNPKMQGKEDKVRKVDLLIRKELGLRAYEAEIQKPTCLVEGFYATTSSKLFRRPEEWNVFGVEKNKIFQHSSSIRQEFLEEELERVLKDHPRYEGIFDPNGYYWNKERHVFYVTNVQYVGMNTSYRRKSYCGGKGSVDHYGIMITTAGLRGEKVGTEEYLIILE